MIIEIEGDAVLASEIAAICVHEDRDDTGKFWELHVILKSDKTITSAFSSEGAVRAAQFNAVKAWKGALKQT